MLLRESPIYQQIARHFEERIFDGRLAAGERLPTTNELAGEFQVNPETVQTALALLTRRGLLERRRGAGTFVRKGVAGRAIAVVFGENNFARLDRAFFNLLFDRITRRLAAAGWEHRHYISTERAEADRAFHDLQGHVADGSVRAVVEFCSNPLIKDWLKTTCPVPHSLCPISIDEADLLEQALLHLLRLGRRDIAVLRNDPDLSSGSNAAVQRQAEAIVARAGCGPARVRVVTTDEIQASGHAATLRLLAAAEGRPDAIASLCDGLTRGAIYALLQSGLGLGDQVALISHANKGVEIFCHLPLTRLEVDPDHFAAAVVAEIQAGIAGTPFTRQPVRAVLVPGLSCGEKP